jgi:hypothetical protein
LAEISTPEYLQRLADVAMAYQQRNPGTRSFEEYAVKVLEVVRPAVERTLQQTAGDNGADVFMYGQDGAITLLQVKWVPPTAADMRTAEDLLQSVLPKTAGQAEEVAAQAVAEATSDPQKGAVIYRIIGSLKQVDLSALQPWPLFLLIYLVVLKLNVADVNAFLATIAIWAFIQTQSK